MSYLPKKNANYFATSTAALRSPAAPPRYTKWPFKPVASATGKIAVPTSAVMVDFETLDTTPSSAIAQLAVLHFNPQESKESIVKDGVIVTNYLDMYIDYSETAQPGRTRSAGTIDWWNEQDPEVIDRVFGPKEGGRMTLADALTKFEDFCYEHKVQAVYCHPPRFDAAIIQSAFETALGREFSVKFFQELDSKTLEQFIFGKGMRGPGEPFAYGDKHMAIDDTIAQALMVQFCYHLRSKFTN